MKCSAPPQQLCSKRCQCWHEVEMENPSFCVPTEALVSISTAPDIQRDKSCSHCSHRLSLENLSFEKHETGWSIPELLDIYNIEHTSMKQDCFSFLISGLGFVSFWGSVLHSTTNQPTNLRWFHSTSQIHDPRLSWSAAPTTIMLCAARRQYSPQVHGESGRKALEVSGKYPLSISFFDHMSIFYLGNRLSELKDTTFCFERLERP